MLLAIFIGYRWFVKSGECFVNDRYPNKGRRDSEGKMNIQESFDNCDIKRAFGCQVYPTMQTDIDFESNDRKEQHHRGANLNFFVELIASLFG